MSERRLQIVRRFALNTSDFDYALPERLIAQTPSARRDESRLLVVHRGTRTLEHRQFRDLPCYLRAGDCLFRNNAAVIPARLHARRPAGGNVECLLLRPAGDDPRVSALRNAQPTGADTIPAGNFWWCLVRPGKKLPVGATFGRAGHFTGTVRLKLDDGTVLVSFATVAADILATANSIGEMPLPPYIDSERNEAQQREDRDRYQTVYADRQRQVAAAAPTAGLHFTPELMAALGAQGVLTADLTLHVGLGTFRPIATEQIEEHLIHQELYEIGVPAQQALFATGGRRIAVGTTSVRTIEDFLSKHPAATVETVVDTAGIFIYPPRTFHGVDALITNFHQPRSTLLCLVAAFLTPGSAEGVSWLKEIYVEVIAREYRFFSYGDAMLIV